MSNHNRSVHSQVTTWRTVVLTSAMTVALFLGGMNTVAQAAPALQIYVEGATYDHDLESWVIAPAGSSAGDPFRLWTIGNVGQRGTISNVRLSMVYDNDYDLVFTLTPVTTNGYGGFYDPSTPINPTYLQTVTDGSTPILTGGQALSPHGAYGEGRTWQEFLLGDFDKTDSPIADFFGELPDPHAHKLGQINVYDISVTTTDNSSAHGAVVIFDLYDGVQAGNKGVFAPFSHNAEVTLVPLPAATLPAATLMGGLGLIGAWRRRRQSAAS